jgi:hypothetical protein
MLISRLTALSLRDDLLQLTSIPLSNAKTCKLAHMCSDLSDCHSGAGSEGKGNDILPVPP